MIDALVEALLDWIFTLLYGLLVAMLSIVDFISSFFDVFAGTSKIIYNGNADFLLNVFMGHDAVTNAFWAMALIAIVLAFGFCIFNVARRVTDVSGTVKQSLGQIMSQFVRCLLILVLLNAMIVAGINITNVLLDRINYALLNAQYLDEDVGGREFTEQEYATMAKVLATIGNYSVNPSADSRYNINSCFNAIRGDLQALEAMGVFEYSYDLTSSGHHTWQSALAELANAADLTRELSLDVYDENVAQAILTISDELSNNASFKPVESVTLPIGTSSELDTDTLLFLIVGMDAARNEKYNTGDIYDSLRNDYVTGEKAYSDVSQVKKDFDIQKIDYFVGYIASVVFILIMAICIFTFIVRLFNIMLLYITAPLFVSTMPLDEGSKFQSWTQAFVIQLFSAFGQVIAMRLYLIVIPIVISNDLIFFAGDGLWVSTLNWFARLLMILGGAWAVLKAGGVLSGILAGNPGMQAIQQEGMIGSKVTAGARSAVQSTASIAKGIGSAALSLPKGVQGVATLPARAVSAVQQWGRGFTDPYHKIGDDTRSRRFQEQDRQQAKEKVNAMRSGGSTGGAKGAGIAPASASAAGAGAGATTGAGSGTGAGAGAAGAASRSRTGAQADASAGGAKTPAGAAAGAPRSRTTPPKPPYPPPPAPPPLNDRSQRRGTPRDNG